MDFVPKTTGGMVGAGRGPEQAREVMKVAEQTVVMQINELRSSIKDLTQALEYLNRELEETKGKLHNTRNFIGME